MTDLMIVGTQCNGRLGLGWGRWLTLACALILAGCGGRVQGTLQDKTWTRTIQVERLDDVQHEGWDVPAGATLVGSRDKVRSTESITCYSDESGFSRCSPPRWDRCDDSTDSVYRDGKTVRRTRRHCELDTWDRWYTYTLPEWVHHPERDFVERGGREDPFAWPEVRGLMTGGGHPERLGQRIAANLLHIQSGDNRYDVPVTDEVWLSARGGDRYALTLGIFGGVTDIARADPGGAGSGWTAQSAP